MGSKGAAETVKTSGTQSDGKCEKGTEYAFHRGTPMADEFITYQFKNNIPKG